METTHKDKVAIKELNFDSFIMYSREKNPDINMFHICRLEGYCGLKTDYFRGGFYGICIILNEGLMYKDSNTTYYLKRGDIVITNPGMVRSWEFISDDLVGFGIIFTSDFLIKGINSSNILNHLTYFNSDDVSLISIKEQELTELSSIVNIIYEIYFSTRSRKGQILRSYLDILLIELQLYAKSKTSDIKITRPLTIVNQFKSLVVKNFINTRSVTEYAEMLNISANHLSDIVKKATGKTPHDLISEIVILEAKILLKHTDMTISEISYYLRFEDSSYFAKFFKKFTTLSPLQYRQK